MAKKPIYITSGDLEVNEERLRDGDQARIEAESGVSIKAIDDTGFVLIDVPG